MVFSRSAGSSTCPATQQIPAPRPPGRPLQPQVEISPPGTPTASPALQRSFLPNGRRPTALPYDINYGAASSVTIVAKPSPATPTVSNQPLRGPFYAQQNFAPDPLEGRTAAPAQKLGHSGSVWQIHSGDPCRATALTAYSASSPTNADDRPQPTGRSGFCRKPVRTSPTCPQRLAETKALPPCRSVTRGAQPLTHPDYLVNAAQHRRIFRRQANTTPGGWLNDKKTEVVHYAKSIRQN